MSQTEERLMILPLKNGKIWKLETLHPAERNCTNKDLEPHYPPPHKKC